MHHMLHRSIGSHDQCDLPVFINFSLSCAYFFLAFEYMSVFTLSKTWQVLGPFPIGTREQDFGADPLENYGKWQ